MSIGFNPMELRNALGELLGKKNKDGSNVRGKAELSFIYLITNKLNGKRYIGKTQRALAARFKEHCINNEKRSRSLIARAIKKYGESNFEVTPIHISLTKDALQIESFYIDKLDTLAPNGYNLISHHSVIKVSNSTKTLMSQSSLGRTAWNKGRKGAQIAWNVGQLNGKWSKPILVTNINTGITTEYPSSAEAVRTLGLNSGHVTQCCKGKLAHHKGYIFQYKGNIK
jgi:GIY-YIG catalytic domain